MMVSILFCLHLSERWGLWAKGGGGRLVGVAMPQNSLPRFELAWCGDLFLGDD